MEGMEGMNLGGGKPKSRLGPYLIIILAIAIPVFLMGTTAVIKFIQLMFFSPVTKGSIPVWAIFLVGFIILLIMRRKKVYGGYA